jgi:hypothetical protein
VQEIGHPATLFPMVESGIGISVLPALALPLPRQYADANSRFHHRKQRCRMANLLHNVRPDSQPAAVTAGKPSGGEATDSGNGAAADAGMPEKPLAVDRGDKPRSTLIQRIFNPGGGEIAPFFSHDFP